MTLKVTKNNLSNRLYFNMIVDIMNKLKDDKDSGKITEKEYNKLYDMQNDFWVQLCKVDKLTKCDSCQEEIAFKDLEKYQGFYYCEDCI